MLGLGWIEIDEIFEAIWGNEFQNVFSRIAVRIDERKPGASLNVSGHEGLHEGAFAHTSSADNSRVILPIGLLDPEGDGRTSRIGLGKIGDVIGCHHVTVAATDSPE